ncbi:hypothetical protein C2S51_037527 [Perilla frutescens var. frutescens]|nr:hypothetical protein C2S51_037527 [Perilla frutescens var. frutescens]
MASGSNGESNHIPEDVLELMNTYANMLQLPKKNGKNNASCGQLPFIRLLSAVARNHAVLKSTKQLSRMMLNEMEKDSISNEAEQSYMDVSFLHLWEWLEQQSHSSSDPCHPLQHATIVAIENSSARDRHLFPVDVQGAADSVQEDHIVPTPTGSPLKR